MRSSLYCNWFSCHFWWYVVFDRWSSGKKTHDQRRAFREKETAGVFSRSMSLTNKSNVLTYTVASSLVCTSPLAVITVVGLLDVLMVSNSAEFMSFSLTMCILAPESTTNSLSSGSLAEALGRTHFSAGEKNVALSFALSLLMFLARFHALLRAHIAVVFQSPHGTDPRVFVA